MTTTQQQTYELSKRAFVAFVAVFILVLFSGASEAYTAPNYGSVSDSFSSFNAFLTRVSAYIGIILNPTNNAGLYVEALFFALWAYRLIVELGKFIFNASSLVGLFTVLMLGFIVRILMTSYDPLTSLLLTWAGDAASAIQFPIVGSNDAFFVSSYVNQIMQSITLPETSIFASISQVLLITALQFVIWILSILSFFALTWGVWGFALAKLVGWFFIPFMLLERTAALFDGWLKLMVGFLVYIFIARANLVLVLILISTYFNLPLSPAGLSVGYAINVSPSNFTEIGGFLSLLVIAVLALLSTGKFATAIASGLGGFGGAIHEASRMAGAGAASLTAVKSRI
jgi:hypothetical protein